jgi:hypothetical protein
MDPMTDTTMLTIEITTGHCLGGEGHDVYPGKILVAPRDLSLADAWKKVRQGYARVVSEALPGPSDTLGPEPLSSGPAIVTSGDPAPDRRDPALEAPQDRRGRLSAGPRR